MKIEDGDGLALDLNFALAVACGANAVINVIGAAAVSQDAALGLAN